MFRWAKKQLGIEELEKRLSQLESRVDSLEQEINRGMTHLYGYKDRTKQELLLMKGQVNDLLDAVEAVISHLENKEGITRAKQLRRRLRNHQTRIENNLISKASK